MTILSSEVEAPAFLVRQAGFEGTLGELAHALRRGTVAPSAIDLLALVHSYLEHFEAVAATNLELASIALPNVAQVIELKLRLLLPRPPRAVDEEEEEELDETLEAVAMLEELDDAIDFLRQRRDQRRIVLPARTPRPDYPRPLRRITTGIDQLATFAARYRPGGYFELSADRLTMSGAMKGLMTQLRRWGRSVLTEVVEQPTWAQLTVYFAGMLELVREGQISAYQQDSYGEIELHLTEVEAAEVA